MELTASTPRIAAALAGAMISIGILVGGAATELAHTSTTYLADYGSAISADNSEAHSAEGGVRHMGDHSHAPGYFERMNGAGE